MSNLTQNMTSNTYELVFAKSFCRYFTFVPPCRTIIRSILDQKMVLRMNDDEYNQFEVTEPQVKILKLFAEQFTDMTPEKWLDMVWVDDGCFLFSCRTSKTDRTNIIRDQMIRAERILTYMIKNGIYKLRTMDGHGRFVMCFLKTIQNYGLDMNDYTIELVDLNEYASLWHELFLPTNVNVVGEYSSNILSTDLSIFSDTCLYLNFCGIGDSTDEVKSFLEEGLKTDDASLRIFISYSRRGAFKKKSILSKRKSPTNLGKLVNWFDKIGTSFCHRGTFHTSILSPIEESAESPIICKKRKRSED